MDPTPSLRTMGQRAVCATALFALAFHAPLASANLVTFEQTPAGATPIDNSVLSAPYAIAGGGTVKFFFDLNLNNAFDAGTDLEPLFEIVGDADPQNGFFNTGTGLFDAPAAGYAAQLGQFFLRQPAGVGAVPAPFIAAYSTSQTIVSLSGEIWDIDGFNTTPPSGTEQWQVDALDASGAVLASVLSPIGITPLLPYDAAPWTFAFTALPPGLANVRINFVGTKTSGVGLAFNNFNPTAAETPVPLPSAGLLLGCGLAALGKLRQRRVVH